MGTLTFFKSGATFLCRCFFFLKVKISSTNARLKNDREERIKMEEKVKYAFLGGIVVLLTKFIFNFPAEDFLMLRSLRGNYDCEPLLGIYSVSNWVVLYI